VLKNAAKTRKVAAEDVLSALSVIEKAKIEPLIRLVDPNHLAEHGCLFLLLRFAHFYSSICIAFHIFYSSSLLDFCAKL
jgi:hypothetical protein